MSCPPHGTAQPRHPPLPWVGQQPVPPPKPQGGLPVPPLEAIRADPLATLTLPLGARPSAALPQAWQPASGIQDTSPSPGVPQSLWTGRPGPLGGAHLPITEGTSRPGTTCAGDVSLDGVGNGDSAGSNCTCPGSHREVGRGRARLDPGRAHCPRTMPAACRSPSCLSVFQWPWGCHPCSVPPTSSGHPTDSTWFLMLQP